MKRLRQLITKDRKIKKKYSFTKKETCKRKAKRREEKAKAELSIFPLKYKSYKKDKK